MGDVVSIADVAAILGPHGEVVATSGPRGGFVERPPASLRFAGDEDDLVHILIRAHEGRPLSLSTLYGATGLKVVQALCRQLARSPDRLIATDASRIKDPFGGEPDPFYLAYIHDAVGPRGHTPGEPLAFVKGVSWAMLNVILKKPAQRPLTFAKPAPATPLVGKASPDALKAPPAEAWEEPGVHYAGGYDPNFSDDPLSGDDE